MKKKIMIASLSIIAVVVAICIYLIYCYNTPIWDSTGVGFPISSSPNPNGPDDYKPYTPADKYVQMLSPPSPVGKHGLPVPQKYTDQMIAMCELNKEIVEEIHTFIAPTNIRIDFKVVGNDTIATYHGKATTKDGEAIEYSRDVVFEGIVLDFVQSYGDVPRE